MGEVGVQPDLAAFLLACIEDDERQAKACAEDPLGYDPVLSWRVGGEESIYVDDTNLPVAVGPWGGGIREQHAEHIAAWDPVRVLVECDTKRRIIELAAKTKTWTDGAAGATAGYAAAVVSDTWKFLALPYADRPGYREEWRP